MAGEQPELFVLGGPNGAGKSTVAGVLLPNELGVSSFVNADLIAQALTPHAPESSAFGAGRMMLRRIRDLREQRQTFGFETTLASKTFAPFLREAQQLGYLAHVLYVSLRNADLAVSRVGIRVSRGGHNIPEDTVRRRFRRSLRNFFHLYLPLADTWTLCDNSGGALVDVAYGRANQEPVIVDQARWEHLREQGVVNGQ